MGCIEVRPGQSHVTLGDSVNAALCQAELWDECNDICQVLSIHKCRVVRLELYFPHAS